MNQPLKNKNKLKEQELQLLKIMVFLGVLGLLFSVALTLLLS